MKIFYLVGNYPSAELQTLRVIENLKDKHEIKIGSYYSNRSWIDLNWGVLKFPYNNYQPLKFKDRFNINNAPKCDYDVFVQAYEFIEEFKPDLIINCDFNLELALIAELLKIEWWSLSHIHFHDGVEIWNKLEKKSYDSFIVKSNNDLNLLDFYGLKPSKKLIYSSLYRLPKVIQLKEDYDWVTPFCVKQLTGITRTISNYNGPCGLAIAENNQRPKLEKLFKDQCPLLKIMDLFEVLASPKKYQLALSEADFIVCSGNNELFSDAIMANKPIIALPNLNDAGEVFNARIINMLSDIGIEYGQIELMNKFAKNEFDKAMDKITSIKYNLDEEIKPNLAELLS